MSDEFRWSTWAGMYLVRLFVIAAVFGSGAWWMQHRVTARLHQAESATNTCVSAAQAKQAAINQLQAAARDNQRQLDAARDEARAALQSRDALQQRLAEQARQRRQHLEEMAHDHADCTALAGMPLCHAVARGLFDSADSRGHAARGNHRDP